ncbi:MAG: DUF835 domain-containing protein [Methanobacteriota archaeon]|nr:MAG: DUF835 domain-containing protein [Euryarchaeota archaeon]
MKIRYVYGGNTIIRYVGAGIALALSIVIIIAVLRQKTIKAFQKNVLIFSILLLVCAIVSNIIISVSAGLITQESSIIYSKKIQAMFDIFMGITMGAFVVAMAVPNINSGRDLLRHMTDRFPSSYFLFCLVMISGLVGVMVTPAEVVFLSGGAYTFIFPTWFLVGIFLVALSVMIFIPIKMRTYLKRARPHKHIVREAYMITGAVIGYSVGELVFEIILPSLSIDIRAAGFVIQISLVGVIAYAIRDKTFLQDLMNPVPEAHLKTKKTYDLPSGYSYLVEESTPSHCFEVFKDLVTHGKQGLAITRTMPRKVRSMYGLEKTPILWLTRVADNPETLRPYPVGKISETIQHFIRAGKNTVVLLDGVEYLILHNDFKTVLTSLQDLNEYIAQQDSIMILPADAEAMEPKHFALLRRDLRMVERPPKIIREVETDKETEEIEDDTGTLELVGRQEKAEVAEGSGLKRGLVLLVCFMAALGMIASSFSNVTIATAYEVPQYTEGNSWTYSVDMTEQYTIQLLGSVQMDIVGEDTISVGQNTYNVVENEVSGSGTFTGTVMDLPAEGDWTLTGTEYWDEQTVERVETYLSVEMEGTLDFGPYQANLTITSTTRTQDDIISDTWQYPIVAGQTGNIVTDKFYNNSVIIEVEGMPPTGMYNETQTLYQVNYKCEELTTITVEAGTYEVYVINKTGVDGSREMNYYLPEAGAGAKVERYDPHGYKIGNYELRSFSYSNGEEPPATILGLPVEYWILIAIAVSTVSILSIAWLLMRRRKNE